MRPHSADLRQRIVTLYEQEEGSIRQLAQRFQVSPDSVHLLVKQYRATGSIALKPYTGGPQPKLQAAHYAVLRELLEADNDATLAQLAERLRERTGVFVSGSTISRTLGQLDITRKKKSQGE
ncbi:MAG: transposase [Cyanobacteria bacterium P01_D01_bin.71]